MLCLANAGRPGSLWKVRGASEAGTWVRASVCIRDELTGRTCYSPDLERLPRTYLL